MQAASEDKSSEIQEKDEKEVVSFDVWFARRAKSIPRLKPWYKDAVRIFMKKWGLGEMQEEREFDQVLEKY